MDGGFMFKDLKTTIAGGIAGIIFIAAGIMAILKHYPALGTSSIIAGIGMIGHGFFSKDK
jgi:hypothetical protein